MALRIRSTDRALPSPYRYQPVGQALGLRRALSPPIREMRAGHEIPHNLLDTHAGRRRAETLADRLHGLARSRERSRSAPHLQAACERSTARFLPVAVEALRQA